MKIIKKAMAMGNGAAVYIPREYSGRQVVILLPEGINDIKKRIIEKLVDHMENIVGVYLFGSHARDESNLLSDIDVLIITKDEDKSLKKLFDDMDVRVTTLERIKKSIENLPAITLPILKEAKTIINPVLLDELKNSKLNYKNFKWNFEDIKRIIRIIETFIEVDKEDISISHIYSLIMRARVCYMIDCLIKNRQFSNREFQAEMIKRELSVKTYEKYYDIYRRVRDGEEIDGKIDKEEITKLIKLIKKYASELENNVKHKALTSYKTRGFKS
ncbi:MAG: nucleotidyltransferase domain-containing protein [Nanoarchaeota archaeon]|nr:nucleotidyltransferase domain-containing protein [Nanoarchaeota archaeon]